MRSWTGKGRFFLHIYVSSSSIMLWFFANFLDDPIIASHNQGRTLKFYLGGCQHALDRLNFSGPTERIWAVRTHWEL